MATKAAENLPLIIKRLNKKHPDARYELNFETPLQLLVATILAAQCTDERVNRVTADLFKKYPDAKSFAAAKLEQLEEDVKPTGFYRNKARMIQNACKALVERFQGEVPRTMEEMLTLPGVARKTANVVLNNAFRIPTGIIVDSHVARVSQRMGLVTSDRPEKIEQELMQLVPKKEWIQFGPAMVLHGRYTCKALKPLCPECPFEDICPKKGVEMTRPESKASAKAATSKKATAKAATSKKAPAKPAAKEASPVASAAASKKPAASNTASLGDFPMRVDLPPSWAKILRPELEKSYFKDLAAFVAGERAHHQVFPPEEDVFNAFKYTPYDRVKVLLLGQDPYHDDGQAHGMCFSVRPGIKPPPSLVNMFKELQSDLGCKVPNNGYLAPWAERGVMLLNAVLTVRAHQPNSHKDRGWEHFTDAVIRALDDRDDPVVFLLWGAYAQKKQKLIDTSRHRVIAMAHPSPLSAKKFLGSKPYSAVNNALKELGKEPIDWQIPDL